MLPDEVITVRNAGLELGVRKDNWNANMPGCSSKGLKKSGNGERLKGRKWRCERTEGNLEIFFPYL